MKIYSIKLLAFAVIFCCTMYPMSSNAAKLTLESKQELPKNMKYKHWSLLKYEDGDILAYEHSHTTFTLVRFDKSFHVKQEFVSKKVPDKMAYIRVDGPQIDVVLYDNKNR